eukprot:Gb_20558 [translate_table: standard]
MGCFKPPKEKSIPTSEDDEFAATLQCRDAFSLLNGHNSVNIRSLSQKSSASRNGGAPSLKKFGSGSHSAPISVGTDSCSSISDFRRSGPIWQSNGVAFSGPALPLPLPLPLPEPVNLRSVANCSTSSSASRPPEVKFYSSVVVANGHGKGSWTPYVSEPKPLPPPKEERAILRSFSWEELAGACQNFSPEFFCRDGGSGPVYKAPLSFNGGENKTDADITRIVSTLPKSIRKWLLELKSMARLEHPHLCKVIGFYAENSSCPTDEKPVSRVVVYASMLNGSLDGLLYGRTGRPPLDWPSRVKIAFGSAQGLEFLHQISPSSVAYRCFQTINVQVDKDFNAKLSDYCFASNASSNPDIAEAYSAPETVKLGEVSPESNVWSFGVVLLELLTGRQNMDMVFPKEEQNLVKFSRPYLVNERKLYLIMDPELKGFYPTKMAKKLADLALRCLEEDPTQRPSMREIVTVIGSVHNTTRSTCPTKKSKVKEILLRQEDSSVLLRSCSVKDNVAGAKLPLVVYEERRRTSSGSPLRLCASLVGGIKNHQAFSLPSETVD